jgi:hypothetical protein
MGTPVPAAGSSVTYTIGSTPTTGPFTVSFVFFEDADLEVYLGGVLQTVGTDYTVTGGGLVDGDPTTGSITLVSAASSTTLFILRNIEIERTTDFLVSGPLIVPALNAELDEKTAIEQDLYWRVTARTVCLDDNDPTASIGSLPDEATRANSGNGTYLGFDGSGNLTVYEGTPATISAAMLPVVGAATVAGALVDLAGGAPTDGELLVGNGTDFALATLTGGNGLTITNGAGTVTLALEAPVTVANGGTGLTAEPSDGELLVGNGTDFALATLTAGEGISVTNGAGSIEVSLNLPVTVADGGTGLTAEPSDGDLLIGNGTDFTLATLTAGSGIEITNGSGSIEIAATAGGGGTVTEIIAGTGLNGGTIDTTGTISLGTPVVVTDGGTGLTTAPSDGELLIGNSSSEFTLAALTAGTGISVANSSGAIEVSLSTPVSIADGGTGTTAAPSDGELLIGNSDDGYTLATLTAGTGISITNSSGSIEITSTYSYTQPTTFGALGTYAAAGALAFALTGGNSYSASSLGLSGSTWRCMGIIIQYDGDSKAGHPAVGLFLRTA